MEENKKLPKEWVMAKTFCEWFGHNRNNWWIGKYRPRYCSRCHSYLGK